MNARTQTRDVAMLAGLSVAAILVGLIISSLEPKWAIAGIVGAVAVGLVLYDYRVGVVCLTFLLPWAASPLLPQTHGFNLVNFLVAASVSSLVISRVLRREPFVPLPRVVFWCYLLPIGLAVLVAWPHLPQGSANLRAHLGRGGVDVFEPIPFLKELVMRPMFYVVYAFLAANAVRDTKRPELFLAVLGLSVLVPAIGIIGTLLAGGDVFDRGEFLTWGMHPNSYAMLLAIASGPLLFITVGSGARLARLASGAAFAIVCTAVVATGSRGGAVALIVILGVWLLSRRKLTDLILVVLLSVVLMLVMPDSVQDRLSMGLGDTTQRELDAGGDALTSSRVWIFETLAPDIWLSPVWGGGLGSTAWNSAVTAGRIFILHPHNMYLEILLDLGFLGFAALMYLYYRYGRTFRALSREPSLSPIVRDYFAGAFVSFLGFLVYCMTNGDYTPRVEQTYLWFSLGLAFAYWPLGQRVGTTIGQKPFGIGVKHSPLSPLGPPRRR